MLEALESLLESGKGGLHFVPTATSAATVKSAAKAAGFAYFHIDGKNIARKEQLLNAFSTALRFPKHFGNNWDALEECLGELEFDGEGCVVYYEHIDGIAAAHPDQLQTLVEICRDAVASWKEDDTPLVFLFSGAKAPKGVPKLKAREGDATL